MIKQREFHPYNDIEGWLAFARLAGGAAPVHAADESDLVFALEVVRAHRLPFWDAMLWASAQRAGVRHLLSEKMVSCYRTSHLSIHST